jgi:hypothetical protein
LLQQSAVIGIGEPSGIFMLADESVIEDVNGDMENEKYHIT